MAKISELPPITGANTRTEDLFVIVNLVQGDDGTSNITREELVEAIQYEIFSRIRITGGVISGVVMRDSRIDNVQIDNSDIEDTDWLRGTIKDTVISNSQLNDNFWLRGTIGDTVITDSSANNIAIIASANFPSKANLIEVKPIQTPINVIALGRIILAFLSETILKLFLGCSINYLLANSVSPAIVF